MSKVSFKKIAHRVCLVCGYYDNMQILNTEDKKKKPAEKAS